MRRIGIGIGLGGGALGAGRQHSTIHGEITRRPPADAGLCAKCSLRVGVGRSGGMQKDNQSTLVAEKKSSTMLVGIEIGEGAPILTELVSLPATSPAKGCAW